MTGLIFLFAISIYYPAYATVKVIESTPSRLVLDWEIAGFDTASYSGIDGMRTNVSFDGGYVEIGDSGAPLLLGYPIYAGVPPLGDVRVSIEPEVTAVLRLANPLRKRTSAPDALSPAYSSSSAWISEPAYTRMRDCRAAYLALRPVNLAGQNSIRVLRKARIVINFPAASHSGAAREPRGDYERMTKRLLLNYSVAQGWQDGRRGLRKSAADQDPHPLFNSDFFNGSQKLASFKVGDGSRNNNEASTKENSLIKISGKKVRELFSSGVPINSVALYASIKGEMGIEAPKDGEIPDGVFEIPILRYDLNGDGSVDENDYFIAYVSGSSDWSYDSVYNNDTLVREFSYKINRYDDRRTYWLTVRGGSSGALMGRFAQPPPAAVEFNFFENNMYLRTPQTLSENSSYGGIDWVWKRFTASRADTAISLDLPGVNAGDTVSLRLIRGRSSGTMSVALDANAVCGGCDDRWASVRAGAANPRSLALRYGGSSASGYYELNGIYLRYKRPTGVSDAAGKLEIFSARDAGVVRYRLSKTGAGPAYIVRVPLDEREISLIDTVRQPLEYAFNDTGNMGTRYMVMLEKDIVDYSDSVNAINRSAADSDFQIRYLRRANRTDYLIITHENFLNAALELAKHKAATGFRYPRVVTLGDVLNQFGGGNTDPAAIRNFLLYVYRYWADSDVLSYVVFFGSGHYDYKNVSTSSVNFMPVPYINNMICDDYYVFFDTSLHPSKGANEVFYFIGRMPAKSSSEAFDMVEKIRETEMPGAVDFGAWRNRVILAADDDQQGAGEDGLASWHYLSSERTSNIITANRPDVDLQKIYLFEYQWDERYSKPGATRAFINEINGGAAVVNWFGHGSANQLADEVLFAKSNIPALYNRKRYPIFTLFSCSNGRFDNPNDDCLASMLVRQPKAGAIVVLSSAREVYSWNNEDLALPFFETLFSSDARFTVGAALKMAKKRRSPHEDDRYYIILGDPSIALTARNRTVNLSIRNAAGKPVNDTLRALQQIVITGTVNMPPGLKDAGFSDGNAFVNLTLFNPPETARRKDGGKYTSPQYILPGSPVFSAKLKVDNGEFEQPLMLPMNLAFNKPGVRLIAYAWKENDTLSGTGIVNNLIFDGTERGAIEDTIPPSISIRPVYNTGTMDSAGMFVKNRVTARLPLTLEIRVKDSSGINVVGSGPDEGLAMEVKGALSKRSINHLFQFEDFMQGVATVPFEENELKSGIHELIISAQDLLGNVSKQSFTIEILERAELKLDHVLNIPNPVRMGRETRFFYYHSNTPGDFDMNITIRIYSLGGRLLAVIRNPKNGEPWIPRDQRGNVLTPNVYLYQITASSSDISKSVKSKIKKLVVHPPR
jgi:hypothetical protein